MPKNNNNLDHRIEKIEDISSRQEVRLTLVEEVLKDIKDTLKSIDKHIEKSTEMNYRLDGVSEQVKAHNEQINKGKRKQQQLERAIFKWGLIVSTISAVGTLVGSTLVIKLIDMLWK